jgi:hypothetical protein
MLILSFPLQRVGDITGILKSHDCTSLLDYDFNNSQIIFNKASTAGFDNACNVALNYQSQAAPAKIPKIIF